MTEEEKHAVGDIDQRLEDLYWAAVRASGGDLWQPRFMTEVQRSLFAAGIDLPTVLRILLT